MVINFCLQKALPWKLFKPKADIIYYFSDFENYA